MRYIYIFIYYIYNDYKIKNQDEKVTYSKNKDFIIIFIKKRRHYSSFERI